jgi:tyrosyl-tRNA synthetase
VPILEGLDGVQKMSKSLGNYVGINEPPAEIYGKLMSVSDALMFRYFELATRVPEEEIADLRRLHPMDAKKRLARAVTAMYHGEAAAALAETQFSRVIQKKELPEKIEIVHLSTPHDGEPAWRVVVQAGLAGSNSEARRQIQQGAVELDGARISDPNQKVMVSGLSRLLQVGKRKFKRFVLEKD